MRTIYGRKRKNCYRSWLAHHLCSIIDSSLKCLQKICPLVSILRVHTFDRQSMCIYPHRSLLGARGSGSNKQNYTSLLTSSLLLPAPGGTNWATVVGSRTTFELPSSLLLFSPLPSTHHLLAARTTPHTLPSWPSFSAPLLYKHCRLGKWCRSRYISPSP